MHFDFKAHYGFLIFLILANAIAFVFKSFWILNPFYKKG